MIDIFQWVATAATVIAALVTASNLGARITGYGFAIFLIGSIAWLTTGILNDQPALVWTNAILTLLNIFGIWRWLGRQAKVEEGARTAAEGSEHTPGEVLVPVSLFSRAKVKINRAPAGHCIDAMAGAASGRLAYLVITDGGVAGVGETMRRLDWAKVDIDGECVRATIAGGAASLPEVERDDWSSR